MRLGGIVQGDAELGEKPREIWAFLFGGPSIPSRPSLVWRGDSAFYDCQNVRRTNALFNQPIHLIRQQLACGRSPSMVRAEISTDCLADAGHR